ncbi:hypothetical protein LCGC14_1357420 [marine sediment metagenome]|uniref:Uncharacterized protein n=1 Tax=marine sediment metagenome TaxID=412755 RepID=A0A0F9K9Q3_9ZZZZ|nr:hypothetical protein [Candidatus Aminicenantes bacterium]
MTDKLKERELLKWLKKWIQECSYNHDCHDCPPKKANPCAKAFLQIEEMIHKKPEEEEIEVRYIEIILDLYDRLEKKTPKVTEEFVKKWADVIHQADTGLFGINRTIRRSSFGIKGELKLVSQMLEEAGVEVVGK